MAVALTVTGRQQSRQQTHKVSRQGKSMRTITINLRIRRSPLADADRVWWGDVYEPIVFRRLSFVHCPANQILHVNVTPFGSFHFEKSTRH